MNSPIFRHLSEPKPISPTPTSPIQNTLVSYNSLTDRVNQFTSYIDESGESNLYYFFIEIVHEIFGRGVSKGWALDNLKTALSPDQHKYIYRDSDTVYQFLQSNGYIFKLCYMLLTGNSPHKFNLYFSDVPIEVKQKLEKSPKLSYYASRFFYQTDSSLPVGLCLNSFEYYMFHFVLFGLKLTSNDILDFNNHSNEQSVYKLLFINYLKHFLPLDNSASLILPQLQLKVLSTFSNQKQLTSPCKLSNFIKKDIACKEFSNDKVENNTWILSSETTWRSEVMAFFFADIWLNCNTSCLPSIDLTKLIRCFIKHLHLYSNSVKHIPVDNLKLILRARHGVRIYKFLEFYMVNWPQDFSFRLLLEIWLCYIQPWRYDDQAQQHYSITECEMNEKWRIFVIRNLLCYTKLFHLVIKRFVCTDICSPRYSIMVLRTLKVFTHPYLLKVMLDIEQMYVSDQSQNKKWNVLLNECLNETEGPLFKYQLMFSEERNYDFKVFYAKLQKSLEHATVEIHKFHEDKLNRNKSSFLELMLTQKKNQKSDYTFSEWEDIHTNLKSSLIFMEQFMKMNNTTVSMLTDLSTNSIFSGNETVYSNIFNTSHIVTQSHEHSTTNLSSRSSIYTKEWEIDPDYLGTLSYESDYLVKLSMYLRNIVESNWNSYILRFSLEESILAGVCRQTLIRAPMKIYSYEPRNDGSGKRVRTPKMVPPTISFRWIASYFTLMWIAFLLSLISVFNSFGFWIILYYVMRIIYFCLKYMVGYSPPFEWQSKN